MNNQTKASKKVVFVSCEECNFGIIFTNDNRKFYYCTEDKVGYNLPSKQKDFTCPKCQEPTELYELYEEDNFCPICRFGYLSVLYSDTQFTIEEADDLYRQAGVVR